MSVTLPGEVAEPRVVNLKLGPGLLQITNSEPEQPTTIITTRVGTLNEASNGRRLWVESNSRRVSRILLIH